MIYHANLPLHYLLQKNSEMPFISVNTHKGVRESILQVCLSTIKSGVGLLR